MAHQESFDRIRVTIIDGVGCGEASDTRSDYPEDIGVNSLVNASRVQSLNAPALQSMGLEHIQGLEDMHTTHRRVDIDNVVGAFGSLDPTSKGNGSPEGHQALMGHIVEDPYLLFDKTGFPSGIVELVRDTIAIVLRRQIEIIRYPGTDDINGVKFINHPTIGPAHLASGEERGPLKIPIYASSDSLVQIALHQGVVPQEQIEAIGKAVREALNEKLYRVARVIMRPFIGNATEGFTRVSSDRRDYGVDPDGPTLIDHLIKETDVQVFGVGKAASMLNYHGFPTRNIRKLKTDEERMGQIVRDIMSEKKGRRLDLDNMVGTDELFGHPRKPREYIDHIAMLDGWVVKGMREMTDRDLWIFTADHGNDPTQTKHTNHTRERTPLLAYSPAIRRAVNLGQRTSFADIAKTIAENFGIADKIKHGRSFLGEL